MPIIIDYQIDGSGLPVSDVIQRCGYLLQDEEHVRWTQAELISWINEAVIATINLRPAAGVRDAVLSLQRGARQVLESSVAQLVDVSHSMAPDGVTPTRAVSRTDRSALDLLAPTWMAKTPGSEVRQFMYDDRNPNVFYVYPPVVDGAKVRAALAAIPDPVETADEIMPLRIEYADAIVNYVCYRAMAKDAEIANGQIAAAFYSAFQGALGAEANGAATTSPNGAGA